MSSDRSLWLLFKLLCSLLCVFVAPVTGQYNQFTSSLSPGHTSWYPSGNGVAPSYTVRSDPPSGTVTVTTAGGGTTTTVIAGRSIPTLVYNCAFMPFICKNIANHVKNHGDWKFDTNGLMKLHVDVTGESNNKKRRDGTCQRKSKKNPSLYAAKDFPNQCQNVATTEGISTLYSKYFTLPVKSVDKQPIMILGPPDPADNTKNLFSGLVYTCDEFPSASWIEGGRGLNNGGVDAAVMCTPQGASCGAGAKAIAAVFGANALGDNPSEQDWQGNALTSLRAAVIRAHKIDIAPAGSNQDSKDPFIGVFFLSTTTQAAPSSSRAWVVNEVKATKIFQRGLKPTASVNKRRSSLGDRQFEPKPFFLSPDGNSVGNISSPDSESVPIVIAASAPRHAIKPLGSLATVEPLWRRNAGSKKLPRHNPLSRGVYHLRGRQVSATEINSAKAVIDAVSPEIQAANARKLAHPRVTDMDGSGSARLVPLNDTVPEPSMNDYKPINETVKEAAALLAEFDAQNGRLEYTWPVSNSSHGKRATSYWYPQMSPKGKSPFNPAGSAYTVYKDAILDCKAMGNGLVDDTKAIQSCISAQNRCGGDSLTCSSTSVMPLVIYFPPGTYLISSNIEIYFQTTLIGDPIDRPILLAASSFQGLGVLSSDFYIPGAGGKSWYINQSNFLRQVRNFIIDIRNTPDNPTGVPAPGPACLHWQVAQATSLQNVDMYMKEGSRGHVGIFMENGSGGLITGLNFHGGYVGFRAGNQQFTIKDLVFTNCRTAIQAIWDWTFLWQNIVITGATTGIDLINQDLKNQAGTQQTFAYLLLDSKISATTGIRTNPFMASDGYAQITLDNVDFAGSGTAIKQTTGETVLAGAPLVDSWMWGIVASKDSPTGRQIKGGAATPVRKKPAGLLGGPNGGYFDKPKPQYETVAAGSFRNALNSGCKGDGVADDTDCLNKLFASPGYVFVPAGVYRVTDTVTIASGLKIVGEAWSAITAAGAKFNDMTKPKVMVQVGQSGQTGDVEIQDIMFQVEGPTAGAVLVEWNIRASSPGSAGMWDCHFRVGGNLGSKLTAKECPRLTGATNTNCIASSLMLHITPWASGYFENIWAWVADHDLESNAGTQIDIYSGRGMLIESTDPTWLYASASEHSVMYQYMIRGANNLFFGMMQTETPYFQSFPVAPKPFDKSVGLFKSDPTFSDCQPGTPGSCMAWGVMIEQSSNVLVYGAGLYSWFQRYNQGCLSEFDCQKKILRLVQDKNIYIYNLATVGTTDMVSSPGAKLDALVHNSPKSNVSSINGWLGDADGTADEGNLPGATITLSKTIWLWPETQSDGKGTMTVACNPPCVFSFPPLTFPPLQPPPVTTTINGGGVTVTPPALSNATIGWGLVTYSGSDVATITPTTNQTAIPVPPWSCGTLCGGGVVTFPPIPIPLPRPTDAPCWLFCDGKKPQHPPVVIGPGPPPGPPPPGSDDSNSNNGTIFPFPGCNSIICPDPCTGPDCTEGQDCKGDDCIAGGSCVGPKCTRSGDCEGPKCVSGGDCEGDNCDHGGNCKGDHCDHGGGCTGLLCHTGGDCIGLLCSRGGFCEGPLCKLGGCVGPCGGGGCVGPTCGGGCTGPNCEEGDDEDDDEDEDDEEEDEEPEFCILNEDVTPNVDTAGPDGRGVSGDTGADSDSGGNVGIGGINGSGTGCIDADDGAIYACGGSGGGGTTTVAPPISTTTTGPPYSGSGCSSYTTTSTCSAGGCTTQALCVPTAPCPPAYLPSGTPVCSPDFPYCLATSVVTRCAKKTANEDAGQTGAIITTPPSLPTPSPSATAESLVGNMQQRNPQLDAFREPLLENLNETGVSINSVFERQANGCGGSANGGCDYLLTCKTCVAITKVPCLEANIHAITGAISGTDVSAQVVEDGVVVCEASINCALWDTDCSGILDYDCGGGSNMSWKWNLIQYTSAKYGTMFPMYLPRTVTDEIVFCWQDLLLRTLPAACIVDDFAYKDGPCDGFKSRRSFLELQELMELS